MPSVFSLAEKSVDITFDFFSQLFLMIAALLFKENNPDVIFSVTTYDLISIKLWSI